MGPTAVLRAHFETHFTFVWRLLRRMGVQGAATDDATQQVFMVLSSKLDRVDPDKVRSFLASTAVRVASNHRRTQARRLESSDTGAIEAARDPSLDPEALLEQRRRRQLLDRALDALPDDLRVVLVLSELEDLSNPEVAELMNAPLGTIASRLRRAREQFRQVAAALRGECEDEHE